MLLFDHMRILGIDYGTKRIGLATTDEMKRLAFPREILLNDENIFKKLATVIKEEKISEIVIGESTDFSGNFNPLETKIKVFTRELKEKFKLPIHQQQEFLTSVEARRYSGERTLSEKSRHVDASAAALLLQRYLDKRNKNSV